MQESCTRINVHHAQYTCLIEEKRHLWTCLPLVYAVPWVGSNGFASPTLRKSMLLASHPRIIALSYEFGRKCPIHVPVVYAATRHQAKKGWPPKDQLSRRPELMQERIREACYLQHGMMLADPVDALLVRIVHGIFLSTPRDTVA